jgi:hypothetical protein
MGAIRRAKTSFHPRLMRPVKFPFGNAFTCAIMLHLSTFQE